jgi:hypothetical protein
MPEEKSPEQEYVQRLVNSCHSAGASGCDSWEALREAFRAGMEHARQSPAEPKAVEDAYEVYKERNQFFVKDRDGVSVKDWNCNPYGFWHEGHALDLARALSTARRDREGGAK